MGGWMDGWVELRLKLTQPPIGVGAELGNIIIKRYISYGRIELNF